MRVAFRADASSQIGLGHLRRCLTLALALQRLGAQPMFLLRRSDVRASDVLDAVGLPSRYLEGLPNVDRIGALSDGEADAQACITSLTALGGLSPALAIVDHYGLDARWHEAVRAAWRCPVAVIDDLADRPLSPDALIDQNLCPQGSHRERYAACLQLKPQRWFCGPSFALLGEPYAQSPEPALADTVRSLGIFLGGTDPLNLSPVALKACREEAGFSGPIEIVSTSANPHLAALQQVLAQDDKAQLSLDLPDLSAFYARHDVQIGAAGGAAWERCAVGVPSLTLSLAENQETVLPELRRREAVATAPGLDAASIAIGLRPLLHDAALRRRLADNSRRIVDGHGARKVALGLWRLAGQALQLRPVTLDDGERIWRWRNHPSTRQVSRSSQAIPLEAHLAWLQRLLASGHSQIFLAFLGQEPIGVIRFDPCSGAGRETPTEAPTQALDPSDPQAFEVSLYLDPHLQGVGLGQALLAAGEAALAEQRSRGPLWVHAEVLPGNESSLALFRAAGYSPGATPLRFLRQLR